MNCLNRAWTLHEAELRGWARNRLGDLDATDDFLQDLFLKALKQGEQFCSVHNARAWLFEVARNALTDRLRVQRDTVELPKDLASPVNEEDTVDSLTTCLARVLSKLFPEDRDAITLCDLQGMAQADYAQAKGITLSAAK
jgi:RNA polymerase sigma-70 factor (ECF subfamily)